MSPRSHRVTRAALAAASAFAVLLALVTVTPRRAIAAHEPGKGVRTVILVRHGVYDEDDARDPSVGKALTDRGREQARLTGERLAHLPTHVDALWSSTFTRARQTADIIGGVLKMTPLRDTDLCECTPPTTREDIMKRERPGALDSCTAQIDRDFARYFRPSPERDSLVVIVAHGNIIRSLMARAVGLDPMRWLNMSIANCSVSQFEIRPDGRIRVISFGDMGHLPVELQGYPAPAWDPGVAPKAK